MNEQPDLKRYFIMFLVITATVIAYQFIVEKFFSPGKENLPVPNKVLNQKSESNLKLPSTPQLMLGSYRNSINLPDSLVLDLKDARIIFTSVGGKIKSYYIKNYKEDLVTKEEKELKIFPLEIFTGDPSLDQKLDFSNYNLDKEGNKVIATLNLGNISVEKDITFDKEGFISSIDIKLNGYNKPFYVLVGSYLKEDQMHTHAGPILDINGSIERIDPEDIKGYKVYKGNIRFAGEESRFFFEGFVGKIFSAEVFRIDLKKNDFTSLILVSGGYPLKAYYGPKEYSYLKKANLESVIDFGLLKIIAKPLFVFLYLIYKYTKSWIIAIFVLTLVVRTVLFPLTYKSMASMSKLSGLSPKMEEIKQKYKDDPVKMQEEIMNLYKEVGFNPASGCLPILLQIPIFFSLYKVIIVTADLKLAHFLWINDLTQKDPYYILPIVMGLTMLAQQRLSPNPDPRQNYIMYLTSAFFVFLFASFPAALVLYWTISNIISFFQTYLIKNVLLKDAYVSSTKQVKDNLKTKKKSS